METDLENVLKTDDPNADTDSLMKQHFSELIEVVNGCTPLQLALKSPDT